MKLQFDKILFIQRLQTDHVEVEFPQFIDSRTEESAVLRILLSDIGDDQALYNQTIADHIRELLEESLIKGRPLKQISEAEMQKYETAEINNQLARGELEIGIQVQMKLALLKASQYYAGTEVVNVAQRQYSIQYLTQPNSTIDIDLWSQLMLAMGVVPKLSMDFRAAQKAEDDNSMKVNTDEQTGDTPEEPSDDPVLQSLMDSFPVDGLKAVPKDGTPIGTILNTPEMYGNPQSSGKSTLGQDGVIVSPDGADGLNFKIKGAMWTDSSSDMNFLFKKFEADSVYPIGIADLRQGQLQFMMMGLVRMDLPFNSNLLWNMTSAESRDNLIKHIWGGSAGMIMKQYGPLSFTERLNKLRIGYKNSRSHGLVQDILALNELQVDVRDSRSLDLVQNTLGLDPANCSNFVDFRLQGVLFFSGGELKEDLNLTAMRLCYARKERSQQDPIGALDPTTFWVEIDDPEIMKEVNRLANIAVVGKPYEKKD